MTNLFLLGLHAPFRRRRLHSLPAYLPWEGHRFEEQEDFRFLAFEQALSRIEGLRRRDLKSKLIELCKSKEEEDIQDFVRILIFHMCSTFLLPNKGYACPSNVTKYVDDLEATWDFSWASAVHDMLMEDLRLFSQRIRRRDAGEVGVSLGYISGCTAALMVWFYEHTRMHKPSAYDLFPRMLRWVRSEDKSPLVRLSEKFHLLTAEQVYPELLIRQDEEHLFRPHEAKLIADKLNMKAIEKRRMEEGMMMSKGKRKLLEMAEERKGKKKKEKEEEKSEVAEEKKGKKKKEAEEEKRGEVGESKEMLVKELRKQNNQLQQELQRLNKRMQTMKVDHGFFVHSLQKQIDSLQSGAKDPAAEPSTPSMAPQGMSPLSDRNMDLSEALTMIDKVVRDSTSAIDNTKEMASKEIPEKKKPVKQTVAPMRRSERLNPTPPSMIRRIKKQPRNRQASKKIGPPYVEPLKKKTVYNVDDDSLKGSEVIELDYGFIEDRRDYDGHDLLSEDDKSQIEGFLSFPITHEAVLRTHRNTEVLGIHIHDILFDGGMTEGYVIDAYFDLLDARFNEKPEVYRPCLFGNHFAQKHNV
ncbi:hypothetical protein QJS10_CPA03g01125 [Acorus calamus]|uniref:Uncharacterized protein n=1 Tax=Acorus calamus TaxID=4465 RepID=A0AAV9F6F1_ACOCL|nr:hypothetical protein QJS10_CPA03g01125 [Acorus calamus]